MKIKTSSRLGRAASPSVDGLLEWGHRFGDLDAANVSSLDGIESVAHDLGHWIALGRVAPPRGLSLGDSIERALMRLGHARRNANEIEAAVISLDALVSLGLRLPRGIWGRVWSSLNTFRVVGGRSRTRPAFPSVRALREHADRIRKTPRIRRLTRAFLEGCVPR